MHTALNAASLDVVTLLVARGADIYLENAKKLTSYALSVVIGESNEEVQNTFFKVNNVVDAREFPLKREHKCRAIVYVN